ncbi:helix-turn-helix domain-containing protein [Flavobacterium sp. W1B]|uniref:helix-turn-helix domain-containing protein n=1 Tax=Flavobacterium sp. W1B TaxID=3394146 RepID=UPI0039BD1BDB
MKFTAEILGQEEPIISIGSSHVYSKKSHFSVKKIGLKKKENQGFSTKVLISEGVFILDTQMCFSTPQNFKIQIIGDTVVMNFISSKSAVVIGENSGRKKDTAQNKHNILFASNYSAMFKIPAFEQMNCLTILLSLDYYSELIQENWGIHDDFSKNITLKKSTYLTSKYGSLNSPILWVIQEIKNCNYEGAIQKMYFEAKIKELLILQLEALLKKPQVAVSIAGTEYAKLQEAKLILEANFTNAPTLAELSRRISLNEFKLKKGFKECFEITVKGYVTKLRMEYAKKLIKKETSNVSEVAEKCGYKDVSHFSAAFKLFYGFTPISFRKNHLTAKLSFLCFEILDVFSVDIFFV